MNQFLKTAPEIKEWLDRMGVKNYRLVVTEEYGIKVDMKGYVDLHAKNLTSIPVKFGHVNGYFDCGSNQLESLMGCPDVVTGDFLCDFNALTSLEHAPQSVKGKFDCSNNKLVSLKGCAKDLGGVFLCHHNRLISLEHGPEAVNNVFNCADNLLTSLDFAPKSLGVGNLFVCEKNLALGDMQGIRDFKKIREMQDIIDQAKKEQFEISKLIEANIDSVIKTYKI